MIPEIWRRQPVAKPAVSAGENLLLALDSSAVLSEVQFWSRGGNAVSESPPDPPAESGIGGTENDE